MIKILIIDQEDHYLISLKEILNETFSVSHVFIANEMNKGLEIAKAEDPNVIFQCIEFALREDFETCNLLKSDPILSDIPIVFFDSASISQSDRERAMKAGADAMLTKPFEKAALTILVKSMIKVKAANICLRNEQIALTPGSFKRTRNNEILEYQDAKAEALTKSDNLLAAIFNTARDSIFVKDTVGKYVMLNPAMASMFGKTTDEIVGLKDSDLFGPEASEMIFNIDSQVYSGKDVEYESTRFLGDETRNFHNVKVPLRDPNGSIIGLFGIARDITEHIRSEEILRNSELRLEELNASRNKLFSIIAHDLKNPFNGIIGFSEMLKTEARNLDINEIASYAAIIYETAVQTYRLLENLLDWTRMHQDRIMFAPKNLLLKDITHQIMQLIGDSASLKKISLKNHVPENLIIKADEDMLKTILRNLISNAIKFTRSGGLVEINAVKTDDHILVSISDNGIGISEENIKKLFDISTNFTIRGTDNEKGTGLGLVLCKEFVQKHGGNIWIESEIEKGSAFHFTIPLSYN